MKATRRSFLLRAGWALVAAAFSPGAVNPAGPTPADRPISRVMAKLSTYMGVARSRALPDEAIEKAKQHILDTLAAIDSGTQLLGGSPALRFTRAYGGEKVCYTHASFSNSARTMELIFRMSLTPATSWPQSSVTRSAWPLSRMYFRRKMRKTLEKAWTAAST